jgi:acetylornithine deacetylase/succinyl-diaminopimelate desuccinylase-like protein
MNDVHSLIDREFDQALTEYLGLVRIPSISTLRSHAEDCQRAAEYVASALSNAGLEHVEVIPTQRNPLVYADWLHVEGKSTVLIYAHYDVQPVDPVDEWRTPPFEPTIIDDVIYARGASDDKLNLMATIWSVKSLLEANKALPVNVRFLFEGEEESGGESIEHYARTYPDRLTSDVVMIGDGGLEEAGKPELGYGCRGILYTEILARGAHTDLHSGSFGGNAPNPLFALAQIVTGLKDDKGHITIPGLYELMADPTDEERAAWSNGETAYVSRLENTIGTELVGEPGINPIERGVARPTLEVHGFIGGFQGEGSKTVIPAAARVKVSLRLVPNMSPANVLPLLERRVKEITHPGIQVEVRLVDGGMPFMTPIDSPTFHAVRSAMEAEFGAPCEIHRHGGSIPISATLQEVLGADTFIIGFVLGSDGIHAPNEHTAVDNLRHGIHGFARILEALGNGQ